MSLHIHTHGAGEQTNCNRLDSRDLLVQTGVGSNIRERLDTRAAGPGPCRSPGDGGSAEGNKVCAL